jgi:hypothetical protein
MFLEEFCCLGRWYLVRGPRLTQVEALRCGSAPDKRIQRDSLAILGINGQLPDVNAKSLFPNPLLEEPFLGE